jgi:hypothetical protein
MYACINETRARFFEGVCLPDSSTTHLHDRPPRPTIRE